MAYRKRGGIDLSFIKKMVDSMPSIMKSSLLEDLDEDYESEYEIGDDYDDEDDVYDDESELCISKDPAMYIRSSGTFCFSVCYRS